LNYTSSKQERVILGERISAEETAQILFAEAEHLARQGNLRGAIRKGYIALLCDLSDRKNHRLPDTKPTAIICAMFVIKTSCIII
jgi:hypothetical protein